MFIDESQKDYLDPFRFKHAGVLPASKEKPYENQAILDAESGRIFSFVTYPEGSIYPTLLEVCGGNHIVSVTGSAAEELWATIGRAGKRRFVKLPNVHGYPDEEQIFDLHKGVLYKHRPGGGMVIESASGTTREKYPEFAETFWRFLSQLVKPVQE